MKNKKKPIKKIRAEIETKKKKTGKINETKTWFFEKINKIDKPLVRLTKKNRERAQVNQIRNEREVITNTTEIPRFLRDYYKQLHANKMYNLEEMDTFLQMYNLPKLNWE